MQRSLVAPKGLAVSEFFVLKSPRGLTRIDPVR